MITPVPLTPELLLANLKANPHPKQTHLEMAGGFAYITINGHKIAYDGEQWFACGEQITPQFSMNSLHQEIDRVFALAQKIKDHILKTDTKEHTSMTDPKAPQPKRPWVRDLQSGLRELAWSTDANTKPTPSWEEIKADCVGPDLPTEQTFVSIDRYRELEAELIKMTASRDATQERVEALQQLLPLFGLGVNAPTNKAQVEIKRLFSRITDLESQVNGLNDEARKIQLVNDQMSDLLAERETLFAKIKGLTVENEGLKSKADRAGLLSVVCRRLCGDENASIETVHAAIDLCHDQANTIDFIGERVGSDPDTTIPNRLSEIRSLVAQAVKSLGEKTVENAKLQEGLTNYKAHVEGLTKRLEQMTFERDTERVGKKWLSETVDELKATTVKLPNEHTLRRLFNRHNAPDKYDDGTAIPTIERFLLIIENLCRNADCSERRFEELNAISTRVNTESEDAHATLDEMDVPRWTTANNHNERYLSLSARVRSVFQTHTKV